MHESDTTEQSTLCTSTKSGAFAIGFLGSGHNLNAGDDLTKGVIPVTGRRNTAGAIGDGGDRVPKCSVMKLCEFNTLSMILQLE